MHTTLQQGDHVGVLTTAQKREDHVLDKKKDKTVTPQLMVPGFLAKNKIYEV
jgi:hypothetical protein